MCNPGERPLRSPGSTNAGRTRFVTYRCRPILALLVVTLLAAGCSSNGSNQAARVTAGATSPTEPVVTQPLSTTPPSAQPLVVTDNNGYRWSIIGTGHAQPDVQQSPPGEMQLFIPVTITNLQTDRPADVAYWMPGNDNLAPADVYLTMPHASYNIAFPHDASGCSTPVGGLCRIHATMVPANGAIQATLEAGASLSFDALTDATPLQANTPLDNIGLGFFATQGGMTDTGPFQTVPITG